MQVWEGEIQYLLKKTVTIVDLDDVSQSVRKLIL